MRIQTNSTDQIPIGRLLADISRLQAARLDQMMEQIDLYRGQAWLLILLSHQDGLTHSELAAELRISPAAATKVIKRLEQRHYVQRRPDPSDERVSRLFMQEEGWAVIDQIHAVFQSFNQLILTDFSDDERDCLHGLLTRLYTNLQDPSCAHHLQTGLTT
jgi:DNA-binding MarR family transcriptional regulator